MKKTAFLFCILLASLAFVSCKNNDRIIDKYEAAINEGRYEDAATILGEIDEDRLTQEQSIRILDISTGGAASKMSGTLLEGMHRAGSAFNEELTDERADKYMDANEKMLDEAFSTYDEVMDEILDD